MAHANIAAAPQSGKPLVFERHGRAVANSREVALCFDKEHKNVLRDIRKLIGYRPELNRLNFEPVELPDAKGELRPTYDMDRDGFALLAMGFTSESALAFKLSYIEAFNTMQAALRGRVPFGLIDVPASRAVAAALNAGTRLATEIRLSAGRRTAAKALPSICDRLGISIDLGVSDTLSQGELGLDEPEPPEGG